MWEAAVPLAVACGVFYGVFCAVLFPLDVLDGIWDLIESVSVGFLAYTFRKTALNSEFILIFDDFIHVEGRDR